MVQPPQIKIGNPNQDYLLKYLDQGNPPDSSFDPGAASPAQGKKVGATPQDPGATTGPVGDPRPPKEGEFPPIPVGPWAPGGPMPQPGAPVPPGAPIYTPNPDEGQHDNDPVQVPGSVNADLLHHIAAGSNKTGQLGMDPGGHPINNQLGQGGQQARAAAGLNSFEDPWTPDPYDPSAPIDTSTPLPAPETPPPAEPGPEAPAQPPASATPRDWNTTDFGQPGMVEEWFAAKGITPFSGSADYWRQKWNEYGRANPSYFLQRLNQAEEIIGRPGSPGNPGPQGGSGGYQDTINVEDHTDPRIMEAIMRMLSEGSTPVSADDPNIRAQFNPQSQIMQRGRARARATAAERAFAQGQTGEGTIDTAANAIDQQSNLDEANLMGQLIGQELTSRRQMVVNALGFAQGEERLQLQRQLAEIDANLRLMGINNQNSQFYDNMGYQIGRDEADYNERLLRLLGG